MGKQRMKQGLRTIESRRKEGRGTGEGKTYVPSIKIHDFASRGLVTRIKGIKTGRIHHLLSSLELSCFYLLDWAKAVTDIREQFPLDESTTLAVARELGLRPPKAQMTTDFLGTLAWNQLVAVNVKYSHQLTLRRTQEKLAIEREYWKRIGANFIVFTEKDVKDILVRNIAWVHAYHRKECIVGILTEDKAARAKRILDDLVRDGRMNIGAATKTVDESLALAPGTGLTLVRHLIGSRAWNVDMTKPIDARHSVEFMRN